MGTNVDEVIAAHRAAGGSFEAAGLTMYCGAGAGSEQTASAVIADLVDVARLAGASDAARQVPHLGFTAAAINDTLAVLPRAAVRTRHYLRVPVHLPAQVEAIGAWLAAQPLLVLSVQLAAPAHLPAGSPPQVLVLTDVVAQAEVDLALHGLSVHPAVTGAVVALKVEMLDA